MPLGGVLRTRSERCFSRFGAVSGEGVGAGMEAKKDQ
jgi:hypothetical protein